MNEDAVLEVAPERHDVGGTITAPVTANKANDAAGNGNTASTGTDDTFAWVVNTLAAGNIPGDEFRIQITDDNNHNAVVFDNRKGSPTDIDSAGPQLIAGGSIVIHKA